MLVVGVVVVVVVVVGVKVDEVVDGGVVVMLHMPDLGLCFAVVTL